MTRIEEERLEQFAASLERSPDRLMVYEGDAIAEHIRALVAYSRRAREVVEAARPFAELLEAADALQRSRGWTEAYSMGFAYGDAECDSEVFRALSQALSALDQVDSSDGASRSGAQVAPPAPDSQAGEVELRETIARIIDPSSWRVMDSYLADVKRKYKNENAGYDPAAFKDKKSLAKADEILVAISALRRPSRGDGSES